MHEIETYQNFRKCCPLMNELEGKKLSNKTGGVNNSHHDCIMLLKRNSYK